MAEYIEREAVIQVLSYYPIKNPGPEDISPAVLETARMAISKIPAADVAPVVHGRFEPVSDDDQDEGQFHCSVCGAPKFFPSGVPLSKYCYNCGARMDGDRDGEK